MLMTMKKLLTLILIALFVGCSQNFDERDRSNGASIYERYQDVDIDYFFSSPAQAPTQHPLYQGLKAKIDGRPDDAERHLESATKAVPDSLRSFVYERLQAINQRNYDWDDVLRYRARTDSTFTPDSKLGQILSQRGVPEVTMDSDTVTVPFDGLYVDGQINGIDRSIPVMLDTGAPGTSVGVSKAFVDRYDLPVDTTVVLGRTVVPALGINDPKYETYIDSITIGGVTIRDVHAHVSYSEGGDSGDDDEESLSGDELGQATLNAGVLRFLFDKIRYNYTDSTFSMIRTVPEREAAPNFAVMSDGWPIVRARADGRSITGVIDTGNLWLSRLFASSFSPSEYEQLGSRTGTYRGSDWSVPYYRVPIRFPGGLRLNEMVIIEGMQRSYRLEANFGEDLWSKGTLVLDYQNRRAYYEAAKKFQ